MKTKLVIWVGVLIVFNGLVLESRAAYQSEPNPTEKIRSDDANSTHVEISFNQQIRPILSDICFNCHGPDTAANEGGVRLDQREFAIGEGDSGESIIIPGDAESSELVRRLTSKDDPMPPADFEKQLTPTQIESISKWIDEGAKYEGHWAFAPPVRPTVPTPQNSSWSQNPIDQFVLANLERHQLQPNQPADRATMIRRLSLDLLGLPPTVAEVQQFIADGSPNAYERLVDRLLMSPHYGERMAIPWLDYARYADSNGFQSDGSRDIWAWREWVINAYNRNLPFDQFTIEQLAGDMLPNPSRAQIVATGFNRNHRLNGEGGRIVDEWFVETVIDRVETTGLTWLGLTFNCCRCHDHKYDPISQREFYQMFAFFNSGEESGVLAPAGKNGENTPPLLELTTPQTDAVVDDFKTRIAAATKATKELQANEPELVAQWASTLSEQKESPTPWSVAELSSIESPDAGDFVKQTDGSFLATGANPDNAVYLMELPITGTRFSGLMIEAFPDKSLPKNFLGRSSNGNFVLTRVEMTINSESEHPIPVEFNRATADFEQPDWTAASVLKDQSGSQNPEAGQPDTGKQGWATLGYQPVRGLPNRIVFATEQAVEIPPQSTATIKLYHESIYAGHNIGRLRIQTTGVAPDQIQLEETRLPENIAQILAIDSAKRSKQQSVQLGAWYRANVPNPIKNSQQTVTDIEAQLEDYQERLPTTMVMREGAQRPAFVLERGEYDQVGQPVERALPAFLPPMPAGQPMNRLGLANWIVDRSNPLTARVWVNRQWENLFGIGIVKTSENFGTQADYPSNPQLLDWLAVEFMEPSCLPNVDGQPAQPWDMKAMTKLIVMSAAYRQSSLVTAEQLDRDPENRWLSRGPRFRLTGEIIRDQALAVSGLLKEQIGGPSVRPYMPAGVWDETSKYGNLRNYQADSGDGLYRRTLYTIWKRTAAPPSMLLFDAPNREVCTVKRSKTNTPLQALALLNEITYVEAAQALARKMIREGGDTLESRIRFGFQTVTARPPTDQELSLLVEGYKSDRQRFVADPETASSFLRSVNDNVFSSLSDSEIPEFAAYSLMANVMLNLDEFVTRE